MKTIPQNAGTKKPINRKPIMDNTRFTLTPKGTKALKEIPPLSEIDSDEYAAECIRTDCPDIYAELVKMTQRGLTVAGVERAGIKAGQHIEFIGLMKQAARHLIRQKDQQTK